MYFLSKFRVFFFFSILETGQAVSTGLFRFFPLILGDFEFLIFVFVLLLTSCDVLGVNLLCEEV